MDWRGTTEDAQSRDLIRRRMGSVKLLCTPNEEKNNSNAAADRTVSGLWDLVKQARVTRSRF